MTHSAKVDWWIVAAILAVITVILLGGNYWIAGPVLLVLYFWAYPQSYETTPRGLLVHAALTRQLIPYEAITFIGRSRRIDIRYGAGSRLFLTPADPDAFLADMAAHTPHLTKRVQPLVVALA
jgi:hypothetical protein